MAKLDESQKYDLVNSAIEDLEIVLDYYMINRLQKKTNVISTNEEILERAYKKLKQINETRDIS